MKRLFIILGLILTVALLSGCFQRSCPTYSGTAGFDYNNHTTSTWKQNKAVKENRKSSTTCPVKEKRY
jgi:hypothetical protein